MSTRVVVVGGGVIGVSAAYWLRLRGADVTLLERDRLAAGASEGNAGTVSAGHPPLNKPGRLPQALKQLADPLGPLYVQPRWDPDLMRWLADFALHCTDDHVQACMRAMAPFGIEALRLFDEVVAEEELACGYRHEGYFDVCRTEKALDGARHEADIVRAHGYRPEVLDGEGLRGAEPALGPDVLGGVYYPEAATLNPHRFLLELADRARARGVAIREGVDVAEVAVRSGKASGVRTAAGEEVAADVVVLSTGPFSLALARKLGTRLPVQPGKGYHRDLPVGEGAAPPLRIACVLNERSVFCTPMDDFVRFAGTMEFSGLNHEMRRPRLEQLTRSARLYLPSLGDAEPRSEWCGLRPMASDGLPIIGPLPGVEGVLVATGHGMLGLTLGPATATLIANYALAGTVDPRWKAFSPARFA